MAGTIKQRQQVRANIEVLLIAEDDQWIAFCPALQVSSYGDTKAEAKRAFLAAVKIFVDETAKRGTLERELLQLGWRLISVPRPIYEPPITSKRIINELNPHHVIREHITLPM